MSTNKEMTAREFYEKVSTANVSADVKTYALTAISKLNERNEKRANKPTKVQEGNAVLKVSILHYFKTHGAAVASTVAAIMGVTTQKASALLRQMVEEGQLVKSEVKIPKKGKQFAYAINGTVTVTSEDEDFEDDGFEDEDGVENEDDSDIEDENAETIE